MRISERTIKRLQEIITGDKKLSAYRSGPELVRFFNDLGFNERYGEGFGSRWAFAESCIREWNGKAELRKIIVAAFDPRDFMGATIYDRLTEEQKPVEIGPALEYVNDFLKFDGFEIVRRGDRYDVADRARGEILLDAKLEPDHLSHAFILEQVEKCRNKISIKDYDGAITNARSLVEAVLIEIEKRFVDPAPDYDGDLPKLYKRVSKLLKLSEDGSQAIDENLKQVMRGFVNIVGGLAGISNRMADRHARQYKPAQHHASLMVNAAMTFCNFMFETYDYQMKRTLVATA